MTNQKESFIKSNMNMTEKQKVSEQKLRDAELRQREKKRLKKAKEKAEKAKAKSDDKVIAECGRNEKGQFVENNIFSVGNGRPPIFTNPDDLAIMIDLYIDDCPDTKTCYNSEGSSHEEKIPTISGLAYFLGFESRQSMYDYKNKDNRFSYIIKRAMFYMEKHYEQIMQGKAPTGAIFALKNMGWKDKTEVDNTHKFTGQAPIEFGDTSKAKK